MKTPAKTKIFVVEDEAIFQEALVHQLQNIYGYKVEAYSNGKACLQNLYKNPDIVLLDYNLLDQNGLEVLKEIKSINSDIHVLLVSGQKNIPVAIDVLKYGAFDYIEKNEKVYNVIPEKVVQMMRISELLSNQKKKRVFRTMALSILFSLVGLAGLVKMIF